MLEGLKVVEFATYIAAPGAGGIMADWGAEVVKIEPPGGDPIRGFFDSIGHVSDVNPVFELDNRGKKGVVLDIAKAQGREALVKLVRGADIFLTNVRPGALKRARLDYATLRTENPRLIYASVTGYGLQGPDADKPGFDGASFWCRSGMAGLITPKGSEPFAIRTGMGDHTTSLATAAAILAAVVERTRTGVGRLVETSLIRTGVYAVGADMAIQLRLGRVASNRPRQDAINPLANFYRTKDGRWISLVPRQGSKDWPPLAKALGLEAMLTDDRFAGAKARKTNAPAFVAELDAAFAALDFEEAAKILDAIDMVWAPVQRAADVAGDPQAEAAGCFVETPDGQGATFRAPAAPARFPGADDGPKGAAPRLGEHTDDVLRALNYTAAEIAALRKSGAAA
jgi:crotonobetainyl-CoA:carnitine CoA-transferase CaiB-like acyl-CoA transferase